MGRLAISGWLVISLSSAVCTADILDLSGVTSASPGFINRTIETTTFSGTVATEGGIAFSPEGNADGDLQLGVATSGVITSTTEAYRLDFAAPVTFRIRGALNLAALNITTAGQSRHRMQRSAYLTQAEPT